MPLYQCPTCKKNWSVARREDAPCRPFCSQRCQMIDLKHWFDEDYVISDPLVPDPEDPDQASADDTSGSE